MGGAGGGRGDSSRSAGSVRDPFPPGRPAGQGGPRMTAPLSIGQPIHLGMHETGRPVYVDLAERMVLVAGEPGGGKSVALTLIVAHAALSPDCRLVLVDGKRVELGAWRACADTFVGPSITDAIGTLKRLQAAMDGRYDELLAAGRRKI